MKLFNQLPFMLALLFTAASLTTVQAGNGKKGENERHEINTSQSTIAWRGEKVTGKHNGTIGIKDGYLMLTDGKLTGGAFTVDMNTIENLDIESDEYKAKLVGHLKSPDFFYVEKYPVATFTVTDVKDKGNGNYDVTGMMTIRGKINKVSFPVKVDASGQVTTATAEITIDRSKYDVKYGSGSFFEGLGDKMIYDEFQLSVKLVTNESGS